MTKAVRWLDRTGMSAAAAVAVLLCQQALFCQEAVADTLESALAYAYVNNPLINSQRAVVRATDESVPTALAGYRPRAVATANVGIQSLSTTIREIGSTTPPNTYRVVEYYRSDIDHYFITADPAEVHYIDTFLSGTFQRTGLYFYAYLDAALAPPGSRPVCRFYASEAVFINSHYYSANLDECLTVLLNWPNIWNLETASAFYIQVPDANGNCPSKTLPVYRFFDGRRDANHRYTVDLSVRRAMLNRAWLSEGSGANGVAFCSPI